MAKLWLEFLYFLFVFRRQSSDCFICLIYSTLFSDAGDLHWEFIARIKSIFVWFYFLWNSNQILVWGGDSVNDWFWLLSFDFYLSRFFPWKLIERKTFFCWGFVYLSSFCFMTKQEIFCFSCGVIIGRFMEWFAKVILMSSATNSWLEPCRMSWFQSYAVSQTIWAHKLIKLNFVCLPNLSILGILEPRNYWIYSSPLFFDLNVKKSESKRILDALWAFNEKNIPQRQAINPANFIRLFLGILIIENPFSIENPWDAKNSNVPQFLLHIQIVLLLKTSATFLWQFQSIISFK